MLIATRQQAWGDREQWAFCLHAAGQDSPLCRDMTSFKAPALDDSIRDHAMHLYDLCPFTVNFKSVISELGYATATLHTQNRQGNLMIASQLV